MARWQSECLSIRTDDPTRLRSRLSKIEIELSPDTEGVGLGKRGVLSGSAISSSHCAGVLSCVDRMEFSSGMNICVDL
jgi:hypothetical protein